MPAGVKRPSPDQSNEGTASQKCNHTRAKTRRHARNLVPRVCGAETSLERCLPSHRRAAEGWAGLCQTKGKRNRDAAAG